MDWYLGQIVDRFPGRGRGQEQENPENIHGRSSKGQGNIIRWVLLGSIDDRYLDRV